jgi:CBS domain containing-hemolysin-like protein
VLEVILPFVIVAVLIGLNGIFVAAEFAIVSVSRVEVERALRENRRWARLVHWFIADPRRQDRYIATAQLGITAASLGLGMYGEHALATWIASRLAGWGGERWIAAHTVASVVAISVLTYFHIVLGEMVPKALALQQPARTSLTVAPVMRGIQLAAYPLVFGLNSIGNGLLRLVGIQRSAGSAEHYRTPQEIAYIVRESEAGGLLRKEAANVISELLEFGDRTAAEIMVPRVRTVGLPLGATPDVLRGLLRSAPHTRYPVYDGTMDRIIGMLHLRDSLAWIREGGPLGRASLRPVPHVPETANTDQVLAAMRQAGVQMVVVMDEHGGTAGIITLEDLFEEVVGDITEHPGEAPELAPIGPDRVRADGAVRVEEVGEALGVVLENEDVDTVSGLVLSVLGRPPVVGDVLDYNGVRFEVLSVLGNGVGSCMVWIPVDEPAEVKDESGGE